MTTRIILGGHTNGSDFVVEYIELNSEDVPNVYLRDGDKEINVEDSIDLIDLANLMVDSLRDDNTEIRLM